MPSASANMSAKFMDQIDTSNRCVIRNRLPADAISPRIVSRSGSPAATSEPNARSRIASVTGQERTSDFSIALLFASLKSDHIPGAPVRLTVVEPCERSASFPFRSSAALTISVGLAAAPPLSRTVRPSFETCGGPTEDTRESDSSRRLASATVASRLPGPWTATIRA